MFARAIALVVTLMVVALSSRAAAVSSIGAGEQAGDVAELPTDLAQVPVSASGFISIRVADLWQSKLVPELLQKIAAADGDAAGDLERGLVKQCEGITGAAPADVERLTIVLPMDLSLSAQSWPIHVATVRPYNRDQVLKIWEGGTAEQVTMSGEAVYRSKQRGGRVLRFLDDRSYQVLVPVSLGVKNPDAEALRETLPLAAGKQPLVACLTPSGILKQVEQKELRRNIPLALLLTTHPVLLTRSATLTFDLGDPSRLQLRLINANENLAAVNVESVQKGLQLLGRLLGKPARPLSGARGTGEESWLLELGRKLLGEVAVQQHGNVTNVSLDLKEDIKSDLAQALAKARVASDRIRSHNNLKQIALALHNYHDAYGHFPPATVKSKDGKPLYSWRVLLLPYMDESALYRKFKTDEPWDSPNNMPLVQLMPKVFAAPGKKEAVPFATHYQVIVGEGAVFEPDRTTNLAQIVDGLSRTVMVAEAAAAVPWSKPEDVDFDPRGPLPKLGGIFKDGFHVAAADASIHFVPDGVAPDTLRALITRAGGENVSFPAEWARTDDLELGEQPVPKPQAPGLVRTTTAGSGASAQPESPRRTQTKSAVSGEWQTFTARMQGFRIDFPGKPQEKYSRLIDNNGRVHEVYRAWLELPGTRMEFSVQCEANSEMDKEKVKQRVEKFLHATMKLHKNHKNPRNIELGEHVGFELIYPRKSGTETSEVVLRYFETGKVGCQIAVRAPENVLSAKETARFLDSFVLLTPDEIRGDGSGTGPDKMLLEDTFSGGEGALLIQHWMDIGPGWDEYGQGAWRIYNKQARIRIQAGQDVIAADAGGPGRMLTCDMTTPAGSVTGLDAGLILRMLDNNNYWMVAFYEKEIQIYKKAGGAFTSLGKVPFPFAPIRTYRLKITMHDNVLAVHVNGAKKLEAKMDAFTTATKFGLRDNSAPNRQPGWANFKVTNKGD
jgi:hypothetical protein